MSVRNGLVPLHRGFDVQVNGGLGGPRARLEINGREAWGPPDEARAFEGEHLEMPLQVGLCGQLAENTAMGVDEGRY